MLESAIAQVPGEPAPQRRLALTRLTPLGTLSRSAGEGGPSPQGGVGEGIAVELLKFVKNRPHRLVGRLSPTSRDRYRISEKRGVGMVLPGEQRRQLVHQHLAGQGEKRRDAQ